jgi:hypothetical protein
MLEMFYDLNNKCMVLLHYENIKRPCHILSNSGTIRTH